MPWLAAAHPPQKQAKVTDGTFWIEISVVWVRKLGQKGKQAMCRSDSKQGQALTEPPPSFFGLLQTSASYFSFFVPPGFSGFIEVAQWCLQPNNSLSFLAPAPFGHDLQNPSVNRYTRGLVGVALWGGRGDLGVCGCWERDVKDRTQWWCWWWWAEAIRIAGE